MYRLMRHGLPFVLLVLLAGCVARHDDGTEIFIRYEYWVPLLGFAVGAAVVFIGYKIVRRVRWALIIGGLGLALGLAPTLALTGVRVTADGFVIRNGFWGMTANASLRFDDISSVHEVTKKVLGSRGQITYQPNLRIELVSGGSVDVPFANDVLRLARKDILQRLTAKRQAGG